MPKSTKAPTTQFVCSQCGYTTPKWLGKCPDCGNFNTLQEEIVRTAETTVARRRFDSKKPRYALVAGRV